MTFWLRITAVLAAATLVASGPIAAQDGAQNWNTAVKVQDDGHILGNPDAPVKLVEFMSYTCSHCAEFLDDGEGAIRLAYVPSGKVSFEIRHLLRDPVDLTAAVLTQCGDPKKFIGNHDAILSKQEEWMKTARDTTQAQRSRWQFGTVAARMQAIASDLGFYDILEARGYTRPELNRCLSNEAKIKSLADTSQRDIQTYNLQGTPSFLINGKLVDAHNWATLQPELDKAVAAPEMASDKQP